MQEHQPQQTENTEDTVPECIVKLEKAWTDLGLSMRECGAEGMFVTMLSLNIRRDGDQFVVETQSPSDRLADGCNAMLENGELSVERAKFMREVVLPHFIMMCRGLETSRNVYESFIERVSAVVGAPQFEEPKETAETSGLEEVPATEPS